jgi:hypothetical protein
MRTRAALFILSALGLAVTAFPGCGAGSGDTTGDSTGTAGSSSVSASGGAGQGPTTSSGGSTGSFVGSGGAAEGGGGGVVVNPCGTGCGPTELCDGIHKGLDDNCDGQVDEGCPCSNGQASSCFIGDPSFIDAPGCLPGTMHCTELGVWGPCIGGKHAVPPDNCQNSDPLGCGPINGVPFQTVDLFSGTGTFDDDAMTDMFEVACPAGVSPCPAPNGNQFQPLQSGEYTVTYTKTVNGMEQSCEFPLYVGARGLRVELSWNYQSSSTIDLDLHMHDPSNTQNWNYSGSPQDCGFANCKEFDFEFAAGDEPEWFPNGNTPPDPVNWYNDTVTPNNAGNLCYFAPRGAGADWESYNHGCHSPRLDLDNISCSPSSSDPSASNFCAPENINIDFPPKNQWIRIAAHYYPGTSTFGGTVTPNVKIFCDGKLSGELGAVGFHNPEAPFTFSSGDKDKEWLVADVLFKQDQCSKECIVEPIYLNGDTTAKNPVVLTNSGSQIQFGPPSPQMP